MCTVRTIALALAVSLVSSAAQADLLVDSAIPSSLQQPGVSMTVGNGEISWYSAGALVLDGTLDLPNINAIFLSDRSFDLLGGATLRARKVSIFAPSISFGAGSIVDISAPTALNIGSNTMGADTCLRVPGAGATLVVSGYESHRVTHDQCAVALRAELAGLRPLDPGAGITLENLVPLPLSDSGGVLLAGFALLAIVLHSGQRRRPEGVGDGQRLPE